MKYYYLTAPILLLCACSTLTPEYHRPEVKLPVQENLSPDAGQKVQHLGWRTFFRDKQLQELIAAALTHNHDLRQAILNIEIARNQYNIKTADSLPSLNANTSARRSRTGRDTGGGRSGIHNTYVAGIGAVFEPDFFGKIRALSDQALNQYLATRQARDKVQLGLIAAVAKTYQQVRIARAQMTLAQRILKSRQQSYHLYQLQAQQGLISPENLSAAQVQTGNAAAGYAAAAGGYQKALNALAKLTGMPLKQLSAITPVNQFTMPTLPAGIASTVLLQRPDIREAEYRLKAANANIGAVRAAMYPSISLTGNLGFAGLALGQLLKHDNNQWNAGLAINLPIFDAGKRKQAVNIAEAQKKQLIENYLHTVENAFYEVADALNAKQTLTTQYQAQQRAATALAERLRLENIRFKHGLNTALDLLEAQQAQDNSRQALLNTQLQLLNNAIDIYIAMGGGLQEYNVILPVQKP